MKNILKLSAGEVRDYFLAEERYCTLDLPKYFTFNGVLQSASTILQVKPLEQLLKEATTKPWDLDDVNYILINNKKARYKWRRFELIHPVLYVGIVEELTQSNNWDLICQRFAEFKQNNNITCCSIPIVDSRKKTVILNWWNSFEQQSIAYSIDYSYMGTTDIENCYPSIYTHSIPWALHGKLFAKNNKNNTSLLGNMLDKYIRAMQYGQTNGIPQGSVLMDFIAEMVLGYADKLLFEKLKQAGIEHYKILRYRDDYRIFANEISVIEEVIKNLAITLTSLNLSLNADKTYISDNIIQDSVKKDKLYTINNPIDNSQTLQKRLLSLYDLSLKYPNSGSLKRELTNLYNNNFECMDKRPNSYEQLISIVLEIMHRNTDTYLLCIGILSALFTFLKPEKIQNYVQRIIQKYQREPFSDYLELWLQRITLYYDRNYPYTCTLCQKLFTNTSIWNSTWFSQTLNESQIINESEVSSITPKLTKAEVDKFTNQYDQ